MSVSAKAEALSFVLMIGGAGGDGGGWGLTASGKLKRIPDNNPGLRKLRVAVNLLNQVEAIEDAALARPVRDAATTLVLQGSKEVSS